MTDKQKKTLILFAQNYSLPTIARKQNVSLSTIRERVKAISKNYSKEFNNALSIREVYKRTQKAIKNTQTFTELSNEYDVLQRIL